MTDPGSDIPVLSGFARRPACRATRVAIASRRLIALDEAGVGHWGEDDRAYPGFLGDHRPARSVVSCGAVRFGARVEIEAIVAVAR